MSSTLLKVASESRSVVAVVGKAHLEGIKKHWKQPVVIEDLMTVPVPSPSLAARIFTGIIDRIIVSVVDVNVEIVVGLLLVKDIIF